MTETDIRYQRGQIYSIRSKQTEMVYYGSTISPLCKRFHNHNKDMEYGKYYSSHEILKFGDAYIELVENYPCNSKKELDRREGQIQRENKQHCINLRIAGRTQKEYNEANKHVRSEYRKANRDAILAHKKEYREANRDAINAKQRERYQAKKTTTASPDQLVSSPSSPPSLPASPSRV